MAWRRRCFRRAAARSASSRAWRPSFFRWRFSLGTAGHATDAAPDHGCGTVAGGRCGARVVKGPAETASKQWSVPQEHEVLDDVASFSKEVGLRLRAVRRQRRLSLDDVERESGGRWSASAVGAYERGFRNLSLPRLRELAEFFEVPMATLLGEPEVRDDRTRAATGNVILDLLALEAAPEEAAPVLRYARSIVLDRGDWNGRILSVRRDDIRGLASISGVDEVTLLERLERWGALAPTGRPRPR